MELMQKLIAKNSNKPHAEPDETKPDHSKGNNDQKDREEAEEAQSPEEELSGMIARVKDLMAQTGQSRYPSIPLPGVSELSEEEQQFQDNVQLSSKISKLFNEGRYKKAIALAEEQRRLCLRWAGPQHTEYAASLQRLAMMYTRLGAFDEGELLLREALPIQERTYGTGHLLHTSILLELAELHEAVGADDKAEPLLIQAVELREERYGRGHEVYAAGLHRLFQHYLLRGAYEKCLPLAESLRAVEDVNCLGALADYYCATGDYQKSEERFTEALRLAQKVQGSDQTQYALLLRKLGWLKKSMGETDRAESLLLESHHLLEETLGRDHPGLAGSLSSLADLCVSLQKTNQAEQLMLECLKLVEKTLGRDHQEFAGTLSKLSLIHI